MKGALSDPDDVLLQAVDRALFPDTAYGFESGGNPRAIPTLSYEAFLDTPARHYNVSNSYTILYGDLDIDRELAFIDGRFRRAEQRDVAAPNPLHIQAPLKAPLTQIEMATVSLSCCCCTCFCYWDRCGSRACACDRSVVRCACRF